MTPKPPKGYRLAAKGETYSGILPVYWLTPSQRWTVWRDLSEETYKGYPEHLSIFAVPLEEFTQLSQELGLYDMTGNPLVRGD